jgi:F0F1-type ATP synthase membrane subunit a
MTTLLGSTGAQTAAAASTSSPAGDIRIATTPIGKVTIPKPGATFTKYALVGLGIVIILVGIIMLAGQEAKKAPARMQKSIERVPLMKFQLKLAKRIVGARTGGIVAEASGE